MARTRIKICGVTSIEDAEMCFSLGADYIGLIFAESPRKVTTETAARIRSNIPEAKIVGVFRDSPLEFIKDTLESCGFDLIQLHGSESNSYCRRLLKETATPIIKAISPGSESCTPEPGNNGFICHYLFDLDKTSISSFLHASTGSLERLWLEAAEVASRGHSIFLGGSLTPGNVRLAIKMVKPFCVDVCRGVEKSPGIKDKKLLKRFIEEVRG